MEPLREGDAIEWLLANVPEGWTQVEVDGQPWGVTRTRRAGGKAFTFSAEQLGASGRLSANLWITSRGTQLKPCEVPTEEVLQFVSALASTRAAQDEHDEDDERA